MSIYRDEPGGPRTPILARADNDGTLGGIDIPHDALNTALSTSEASLTHFAGRLGERLGLLPHAVLTADTRPLIARRSYTGQEAIARTFASALEKDSDVPDALSDAAKLTDLANRREVYGGLQLIGERAQNAGMDLRLVYGTFQWHLIDLALTHLERRFDDPQLTRTELETLLDCFGPMLLRVDAMLRRGPERKDELSRMRQRAEGEAQSAQAEADAAETVLQLHTQLSPGRERLLQAARLHLGQDKAGAHLPETPGGPFVPYQAKADGAAPRKIIR